MRLFQVMCNPFRTKPKNASRDTQTIILETPRVGSGFPYPLFAMANTHEKDAKPWRRCRGAKLRASCELVL